MSIQTVTNKFGVANWIVDPKLGLGTHMSISGALASASAGDTIFIRSGIYTENLILKDGVNLAAFSLDGETPTVTIIGQIVFNTGGSAGISGIRLQTNRTNLLSVGGASATTVNLRNCYLNMTNGHGISFSTSNSSSKIALYNCNGDLANTGIKVFDSTSTGTLVFYYCQITNNGGSTTASTVSAGTLSIQFCGWFSPVSTSGTATFFSNGNSYSTANQNVISLAAGGSGPHSSTLDSIFSGSASAISVSSAITLRSPVLGSNNANIVTGTGTCQYEDVNPDGNAGIINAANNIGGANYFGGISFDRGSNILNAYTAPVGWSPTLAFGGATTGITYNQRAGYYARIGNTVYFSVAISLSSKGSATGAATITNLPISTGANGNTMFGSVGVFNMTLPANYYSVNWALSNNSSVMNINLSGSNQTYINADNTHFSNTALLRFTGHYFIV